MTADRTDNIMSQQRHRGLALIKHKAFFHSFQHFKCVVIQVSHTSGGEIKLQLYSALAHYGVYIDKLPHVSSGYLLHLSRIEDA